MANKFLIAAGGNWTADTSWSTTSGGVNDTTKPTAADDVILDNLSGACVIDESTAVCRSLNCTGYTNTLTHNAGVNLTIGDGTAGASNIALKLVSGMTYTLGNSVTSSITIASTSATAQTIDYGTKTAGLLTILNGPGTLTWVDSHTFNTVPQFPNGNRTILVTAGTTTTFSAGNSFGNGLNNITFNSTVNGTAYTFSKAASTGPMRANRLILRDSTVLGGAQWYAGAFSQNVSGNTGWIFENAPLPSMVISTSGTNIPIGTNINLYSITVGSVPTKVQLVSNSVLQIETTRSVSFAHPIALTGPATATSSGGVFTVFYKERSIIN